jgi:M-phase phosphoprotein 6
MWRPGDAKPQAKGKRKAPGRSNSSRNNSNNGNNSRNRESSAKSIAMEGPAESVPSTQTEATTSPKMLSGALMNMKFMKRQQTAQQQQQRQQQRHDEAKQAATTTSPNHPKSSVEQQHDPMDLEMETNSPLVLHASSTITVEGAAAATEDALLVDMTPANNSDMYGISGCVIGRRSFGGFNRSMEDTWKASYHTLKEQQGGDRNNKQVSDEDLLKRYATLVKHKNNNRNISNAYDEDASRRPVGNLGDKVKPRQKRTIGSGEKRKR